MDKSLIRSLRPALLIFVFVTAFCITGRQWLEKKGVNTDVLLGGNLILLIISLLAYLLLRRAVSSDNPNAFVRAIYGSFMLRFFLLAIAAFIYIMVANKDVNKPALIACAGLYIVYTAIETRSLMKMLKQNKHA